ncbi:MAG: hypothetical protein NTV01_05700 [Bacteroidia bacterium]|nr:hypothetical protein [Bacteroidia bacterium]
MKRFLPFLFVLVLIPMAFGQLRSEQDAANIITQPSKSVRGDSLKSQSNFTANQWAPIHALKHLQSCRGAVVLPSGSAGYLAVHLKGDPSGAWYKIYLANDGVPIGAEFDAVGDSTKGTTVKLDTNLFVFPYLYK